MHMAAERSPEPFTYGSYLRVPELISLQTPLADPPVPDELLFVIGQQAQELWFKQILSDLQRAIGLLGEAQLLAAASLIERDVRILRTLSAETELLELIAPAEFHRFRGILKAASGLESEQFRELELASGLRDDGFLRLAGKLIDLPAVLARWPVSLHAAFLVVLQPVVDDPVQALMAIYAEPDRFPELYRLSEALGEYELRFQEWHFHHLQVVERVIGDRSPGTGGSAGSAYLARTLSYRFFPELWEARNRLTAVTRQ
jgi:tryptophan 2,3-dioxygenase